MNKYRPITDEDKLGHVVALAISVKKEMPDGTPFEDVVAMPCYWDLEKELWMTAVGFAVENRGEIKGIID